MPADIWHGQKIAGKGDSGAGTTPTDSVLAVGGGGYVGSLVKVQRVSKKLFRRSELAMIGQPEGNTAGFAPCHFKVRKIKWYLLTAASDVCTVVLLAPFFV